jgi:hypothetical protein
MVEIKKLVSDVKFVPPNFGLNIVTASSDGSIRIHEAPDVFDRLKLDLLVSVR